jgi:hypothetical protein
LSFDGVNDYVDVIDNSALKPSFITVSFWIKVNNADNVAFPVPLVKLPINENFLFVIDSDNKPIWRIDVLGSGTDHDAKDTSSVVSVGSWEHWVGTYDGKTVRFYRNGNQRATKSITGTLAADAGNLVIGGQSGGGNAFDGQLDNIDIYNRALAPQEIKQLYNGGIRGAAYEMDGLASPFVTQWGSVAEAAAAFEAAWGANATTVAGIASGL